MNFLKKLSDAISTPFEIIGFILIVLSVLASIPFWGIWALYGFCRLVE